MSDRLKIFFDGGCRGTAGVIETAVVIRGVAHLRSDHPPGTSTEAEWLALVDAATLAVASGVNDVVFVGDSIVVLNQARGVSVTRGENLQRHRAAFTALAAQIPYVAYRHVNRAQNLAGTALERLHGRR
ncbi:hypothetical protein ASE75_05500 [Sphingomonas sp. Leaf17]|uniref:reverse transcriptase-like protein n=1 Tax=Sphingomonas sp. Leaf17 TaxID=1735683 RepID=UPI0007008D13|nr:reverse transcriptase-like protein [Sphingomonas sp. Leaf17]KQM65695.1 hypothetical protein ASE75_05500 [Sphingomonas sp. Leaf17]